MNPVTRKIDKVRRWLGISSKYSFTQSTKKVARDVSLVAIALVVMYYTDDMKSLGLYPVLKYFWDALKHGGMPSFKKLRELLGV